MFDITYKLAHNIWPSEMQHTYGGEAHGHGGGTMQVDGFEFVFIMKAVDISMLPREALVDLQFKLETSLLIRDQKPFGAHPFGTCS